MPSRRMLHANFSINQESNWNIRNAKCSMHVCASIKQMLLYGLALYVQMCIRWVNENHSADKKYVSSNMLRMFPYIFKIGTYGTTV